MISDPLKNPCPTCQRQNESIKVTVGDTSLRDLSQYQAASQSEKLWIARDPVKFCESRWLWINKTNFTQNLFAHLVTEDNKHTGHVKWNHELRSRWKAWGFHQIVEKPDVLAEVGVQPPISWHLSQHQLAPTVASSMAPLWPWWGRHAQRFDRSHDLGCNRSSPPWAAMAGLSQRHGNRVLKKERSRSQHDESESTIY